MVRILIGASLWFCGHSNGSPPTWANTFSALHLKYLTINLKLIKCFTSKPRIQLIVVVLVTYTVSDCLIPNARREVMPYHVVEKWHKLLAANCLKCFLYQLEVVWGSFASLHWWQRAWWELRFYMLLFFMIFCRCWCCTLPHQKYPVLLFQQLSFLCLNVKGDVACSCAMAYHALCLARFCYGRTCLRLLQQPKCFQYPHIKKVPLQLSVWRGLLLCCSSVMFWYWFWTLLCKWSWMKKTNTRKSEWQD